MNVKKGGEWNSNSCSWSCCLCIDFECRSSWLIKRLNVDTGHKLQTFVRYWQFLIPVMDCSSGFKSEEYKTYPEDGSIIFLWIVPKFLPDVACCRFPINGNCNCCHKSVLLRMYCRLEKDSFDYHFISLKVWMLGLYSYTKEKCGCLNSVLCFTLRYIFVYGVNMSYILCVIVCILSFYYILILVTHVYFSLLY